MTLVILGAVFIGTLSVLVGAYIFANRRRLSDAATARERLRLDPAAAAAALLRDERVSELPLLDRLLRGRTFAEELATQLQRAGSPMSAGMFLLLQAGAVLAGLLLGNLLGQVVFVVLGAILGAALPVLWLRRRVRKRLDAFQTQLPEAIDMLVTSMRAGYSFQAAMRFIGQEMPAPLGPEFARFYDEQRLGMDVRTALIGMLDRVHSLDLKMLVTAVLIQRETGGTLSDVLANIAALMRERVTVRAQIETLTAEPKLSARVLASAPVVVYLGLLAVDKEYVQPLTGEGLGRLMLVAAALSVGIGYWILMQLADIDF